MYKYYTINNQIKYPNELYHYGVKGMKWGKHKAKGYNSVGESYNFKANDPDEYPEDEAKQKAWDYRQSQRTGLRKRGWARFHGNIVASPADRKAVRAIRDKQHPFLAGTERAISFVTEKAYKTATATATRLSIWRDNGARYARDLLAKYR